MELLDLPNELLDLIVQCRARPEDLENVALTCKHLHAICFRWLPEHNRLRKRFRKFEYSSFKPTPDDDYPMPIAFPIREPYTIYSAFDMLGLIAAEPDVAFHIQEADFTEDSMIWNPIERPHDYTTDLDHENAVKHLLASSPYFDGVDRWEDYYAEIKDELYTTWSDYSPHAAAFLLSLLPNIERLKVPFLWSSGHAGADRLVKRIVCKSRELGSESSLSQVTHLFLRDRLIDFKHPSKLDYISSSECLFRLPRLRVFVSQYQRPWDAQELQALSLGNLPLESAVETIRFEYPIMSPSDFGIFFGSCPKLKALTLAHGNPFRTRDQAVKWDICSTIKAIEQKIGTQLEVLELAHEQVLGIRHGRGRAEGEMKRDPLEPGRASLLGFSKLYDLFLPLEVITNTLNDCPGEPVEPLLHGLIPPTVKILSLTSFGREWEAATLETVYQFLNTQRRILEKFTLLSNEHGSFEHYKRFRKVCDDFKSMGVEVQVIEMSVDWL